MSIDGTWAFEVAGLYGWERFSTVFLEQGRYLGGSANTHGSGTYKIDGRDVEFKVDVVLHSSEKVFFGEKRDHFSTILNAKISKDKIQGTARLKGARSTTPQYRFRLIRLADVPELPN